ncbi:MAG: PAS domain S-box protein [Thermoanaerobaculum sp.]
MEQTLAVQSRRLWLWFWVWLVGLTAIAWGVFWLDTKHEQAQEIAFQERLFATAVERLAREAEVLERAMKGDVGEGDEAVAGWPEKPLLGFVGSARVGARSWPRILEPMAQKLEAELGPDRLGVFLNDGAFSNRGVVAVRASGSGAGGVLVFEIPRLLVGFMRPDPDHGPLVILVAVPGGTRRSFACEPQANEPWGWSCFSQRAEFLEKASFQLGEGRVVLREGTLLTRRARLGSESVHVGLFVPRGGSRGVSLAWLAVVALWALAVGSGVLAVGWGERLMAEVAGSRGMLAKLEAEVSARVSEASWRLLLEDITEPLLALRDDMVVRANQQAARLLGFEQRADLLGRSLAELVVPEERERVAKLLPAATLSRGAFTTYVQGGNGRRRTVEVHPWPLGGAGEPLICLSLEDFTAREGLEKVLRAVCSSVNVGIAYLKVEGTVAWANRAMAETLGLTPEDLEDQSLLPFVMPTSRRVVRRAFVRVLRGESASVVASCRLHGDMASSLALAFQPISVAGAVAGVVLVAQPAGLAPSHLASADVWGPIHELTAHLLHRMGNTVQGLITKPPAGKGAAGALRETFGRLASQIHELGVFFRGCGPGLSPVDLNGLLAEAEKGVRSLVPAGVRLVVRPWPEPVWVQGDGEQLQAFLRGAVEASLECVQGGVGTVEMSVELLGGRAVRLAVSDTGEVFDGTSRDSVPFSARLRARAMALGVARRHLGEAGFRERVGFGARVWVDLPASPAVAVTAPSVTPRKGKILIVDDDPAVREGLASLLQGEGYQVVEAANGREALALYDADPGGIALVVLDLVMPEMDGREVYAELTHRPDPPSVLLATGYDPKSDPLLSTAQTLTKPFTAEAFLEAVKRLVLLP